MRRRWVWRREVGRAKERKTARINYIVEDQRVYVITLAVRLSPRAATRSGQAETGRLWHSAMATDTDRSDQIREIGRWQT
ncbi:hypothetical protein RRG08_020912 [Elysia crispata]|uniref:Uncharacterized protein n=1 Tax=Elysia crispata TaxID=231223 RepID=A0AAE1AFY2_9GAST|nr:hypothetical protein RRG08_020912 [Elysia crispata]